MEFKKNAWASCTAPGPGSSCLWPLVPRPALDGAEGDRETGALLSGFAYTLVPDPGPDELLFPLP